MAAVDPDNRVDWAFRARSRALVDQNPRSRENKMRRCLERLLGMQCPKVRPAFLVNPATKHRLELDAYCEHLKIACEFQGIQHAEYPNPVHTTRKAFEAQVARDRLKVELCKQHSVMLVAVPHTVARQHIAAFLRAALKEVVQQATATGDAPQPEGPCSKSVILRDPSQAPV